MPASLLALLSHDWAGLVLVAVLALPALLAARSARGTWLRAAGYGLLVVAVPLGSGATYHALHMAGVHRAYPPPGRMVDVGGYRLHVLAEGEANGKAPVVWMPGGHEAGIALYHLHRALRMEARSVLIDRPGTGWSDPGPFPRTTQREAEEVYAALTASGERGPFVFAGHSYGGLLVANIARRHPQAVAAVVLLDATPPDGINYTPPNPYLLEMRRTALLTGIERLFGLHHDTMERLAGRDADTEARRVGDIMAIELKPELERMRSLEDGAKTSLADYSIFAELQRGGLGWENTVYDGELGTLPVYLVAPRGIPNFAAFASTLYAAAGEDRGPEAAFLARLGAFEDRMRERYMQVAEHVERIAAPAGSSHNFVYEHPDFVIATMRRVLAEHPVGSQR